MAGAGEQELGHRVKRYRVVRVRRPAISTALTAALLWTGSIAAGADGRSLEERCEAEVVDLHRFIEQWSNAELPETDEAFARFDDVIAPSFVIIDADGVLIERQPIVDAVRGAYGRWRDAAGRIRIENFRLHQHGDGLAMATYEEWHDLGRVRVGRLSSILFGANPAAPNGLEWLHLHEVWVPGYAPAD
jgi:hypothetical protein